SLIGSLPYFPIMKSWCPPTKKPDIIIANMNATKNPKAT
ncbi:unnamed protein product, partial [marine sediment metagenome]